MKVNPIPVFYGCDERFLPYMAVSLKSLILHADKKRTYEIHILHTGIDKELQNIVKSFKTENVVIKFDDVSAKINYLVSSFPLRDYYSPSTYYRFLIAKMFPRFNKALYIDGDTIINNDVSKLFDIPLGKNLVGAVPEAVANAIKEVGMYAEKCLGIAKNHYFNAGIISINCQAWRDNDVLGQFTALLKRFDFRIAQDQDYLNVICYNKVKYLPRRYNVEAIKKYPISKDHIAIIHYAFAAKPWHDINSPYSSYFWKTAMKTPFYKQIKAAWKAYTPEQLSLDQKAANMVAVSCLQEIVNPDNYMATLRRENASFVGSFGLEPLGI